MHGHDRQPRALCGLPRAYLRRPDHHHRAGQLQPVGATALPLSHTRLPVRFKNTQHHHSDDRGTEGLSVAESGNPEKPKTETITRARGSAFVGSAEAVSNDGARSPGLLRAPRGGHPLSLHHRRRRDIQCHRSRQSVPEREIASLTVTARESAAHARHVVRAAGAAPDGVQLLVPRGARVKQIDKLIARGCY
jgi:hypothetical protein